MAGLKYIRQQTNKKQSSKQKLSPKASENKSSHVLSPRLATPDLTSNTIPLDLVTPVVSSAPAIESGAIKAKTSFFNTLSVLKDLKANKPPTPPRCQSERSRISDKV